MTWLGWYDPDRKKPARMKLADAVDRHMEKFGRAATVCLVSPVDAEELTDPKAKGPDPIVEIHPRNYIARWTYYVGENASSKPALMAEDV